MNYKDKTFEIDENQIKFKNTTIIIYLTIFISTGLTFGFLNNSILPSILGAALGILLVLGVLVRFYWKNTIDLSDIDFVKTQKWDERIDKDRNFWGTGRYKYYFPTGLNRKTNPEVIFVHIKERKAAVGFVPENMENAISALKERGIRITTGISNSVSA